MSLRDYILPLAQIAAELRALRELYEMDLAERNPPIIRITEKPRRADTEVSYMDAPEDKRPGWKKATDAFFRPDSDDLGAEE